MIQTRENRSSSRKTFPIASLSTTNPIQTGHIQLQEYWKSESVVCDVIRFGCVLQDSFPYRYQICFSLYGQDRVLRNVNAT